eukprot:10770328-Ditylum_brightwellii.AAC.1
MGINLNFKENSISWRDYQKHKELFDGTLGMWKNFQYNIKLQEGVKPHHSSLYTVPKVYKAMLCTKLCPGPTAQPSTIHPTY